MIRFRSLRAWAWLTMVLLLSALALFSAPAEEKRVTLYSTVAQYSLTVSEHEGHDYVGLLDVLEPLGHVTATGNRLRWQLRFDSVNADFVPGSNRATVRGSGVDLGANFVLENGRGLVPVAALGTLMSRILGGPVTLHEASRRVFVGSVAVHFTAQMGKSNPPGLVMNFSSPVNPMIATEPGKLRMVFRHEPLVSPGSAALTFDSAVIPSATYEEENGAAVVTINGAVPLFASFSDNGRTITIGAAQQPATTPPAAAPESAPATPAAAELPAATPPPAPAVAFFAVLDASHGGNERGAALTSQLAEKEVTLAIARLLRRELEARHLPTLILRDGDGSLTLDQRAGLANTAHPSIYVSLHASSDDHGVRLYTALLPVAGESSGPFLDWDTAQTGILPASQSAATGLGAELKRRNIPVRVLVAPLRPLNNIAAPAVAVEVAPPEEGISQLTSTDYEQQVASGIAAGLLLVRDKLNAGAGK